MKEMTNVRVAFELKEKGQSEGPIYWTQVNTNENDLRHKNGLH